MSGDHDSTEEGARGQRPGAPRLSPREARQGRIVLDTRAKRWIFFGGLIAILVGAFALSA